MNAQEKCLKFIKSSIWSSLASSTSISKLQIMQNAALRTATECTQDTKIQHLHDETLILPMHLHLQLHASQYKQKTQHLPHPLHKNATYFNTPRRNHYLLQRLIHNTHSHRPHTVTTTDIKKTCTIYIHLLSLCI